MAIRERTGQKPGRERRISFGRYQLNGTEDDLRLTIPAGLDHYGFPNVLGKEVVIEHVQTESGETRLEVFPVGE